MASDIEKILKAVREKNRHIKLYRNRDKDEAKEKTMAPHSTTLAWTILWTEEPGGLWSMGSLKVGHN